MARNSGKNAPNAGTAAAAQELFAPHDPACHFAKAEIMGVGTTQFSVLGGDIMVQTPNAHGLLADLDRLGNTAGTQHAYTQADVALLTARVEARVKEMMTAGASDAEIQAAVGLLTTNYPGLAHIAAQVAQKQMDVAKFNIFDTRDAAGTGEERSGQAMFNPLAVLFGLAIASEVSSLAVTTAVGPQTPAASPLLTGLRPDGRIV